MTDHDMLGMFYAFIFTTTLGAALIAFWLRQQWWPKWLIIALVPTNMHLCLSELRARDTARAYWHQIPSVEEVER